MCFSVSCHLLLPTLPYLTYLSKSEKVERCKSEKMQPPQYEITMQGRQLFFHSFTFPLFHLYTFQLALSPFHSFTFKLLTNCKFSRCQEIGRCFARVPIEVANLFSACKNARILRLCIVLIIKYLCVSEQILSSFYPSETP